MGLLLCVRHGFILPTSIYLDGWSSPYDKVSFVISRLGHSGIVLASGVRDGMAAARNIPCFNWSALV